MARHGMTNMSKIDLFLINPGSKSRLYGTLTELSAVEPPLLSALTASFIREKGYSVEIIDQEMEGSSSQDIANRILEKNPVLVAISVMGLTPATSSTPKMGAVGEIIRELKQKAKTIVGGLHPSSLPERTLREEKPDFVCQGEGFVTIWQLLDILKSGGKVENHIVPGLWYLKDGKLVSNLRAPLVDIDRLPMPAWDLLPMEKYRCHNWHALADLDKRSPYGVIATSYGCPYNCHFCNIHSLYSGKPGIRFRNPEKVVEEIAFLVRNYGIKNLKIWDELFTINHNHTERICDLLIERGYDLNIWCYGRVNTVNEALLKKMKQAGVNWIAYGFESASEIVRQGVGKKFSQEGVERTIEITRDAGINIQANYIFGLPEDDLNSMQVTLDMAKSYNFEWGNFYVYMPYPGSQLYNDAIRQGAKLPREWCDWAQYSPKLAPLPTKHLTSRQILQFRDQAFIDYFSREAYLEMIEKKFGINAVNHIKAMLQIKLIRA